MFQAGLYFILVSLVLAWLLVVLRYLLKVDEEKIATTQVLKAHIDYLLMGILLLLFSGFNVSYSSWIVTLAIVGAVSNPFMFLVLAFKPRVSKAPFSLFGITSTLSFIVTTLGFGGLCIQALQAQT